MSAELVWKIAKFAIPFIIGFVIGGAIVGKVQQIRIDAKAVELTKVRQELTVCQEANATSEATIGSMKAELQSVRASCTTRLRQKERTAAEIKRIDGLKPGVKTDEIKSDAMDSGDPVLDGLNRMYPNEGQPTDRKD